MGVMLSSVVLFFLHLHVWFLWFVGFYVSMYLYFVWFPTFAQFLSPPLYIFVALVKKEVEESFTPVTK